MKEIVASLIQKEIKNHLKKEDIENLIEIPPSNVMGDFAFPCFALAKELKKNPAEIAKDLAKKIKSSEFEKIEARGPYLNFFVNRASAAEDVLGEIQKQKDSYGSSNLGKGKVIVIDMSSPNIAKPFGIGHLRSTIIGNSISNICEFAGFKAKKLNYYGDWGTPFGKIIAGYEKFGNAKKLEKEPIKHLYEIYTKVSKNEDYEEIGREYFKKLEGNDKKVLAFWKKFRELSINDFNKIYSLLNIKFDVISSESEYNSKMEATINELKQK